jgi:benzylsuccinate CoA-transferase BbsF subunit
MVVHKRENEEQMPLALQGIRVLDLTDAVAGPFATLLMADCGAEVIRIESLRHLGFRGDFLTPIKRNDNSLPISQDQIDFSNVDLSMLMNTNFTRFALNKLSVALNLTKPEARDIFKKLVKVSDVIVDNLTFGVMQNWGLEYDTLRQIKNDIIVVSMPSFGKGSHENWTTWGMNLLSFTGFAYYWGHQETPMEERAASNYYGDYIAGTETLTAILAALYHRAKTGEGQYIEVTQTETTASLLGPIYLDYFVNNRVAPVRGNRHPEFAPYNSYRCKGDDRWCVIAVFNENEWHQLCSVISAPGSGNIVGSTDWIKDPKFQNMETRLKNAAELDRNIEAWTKQYTPHQVMRMLQSAGVSAGAVQNSEDLYFDIQLRARGHMVDVDAEEQGHITFDGPPVRLSAGRKTQTKRAPVLGEHNDYVYKQLLGLNSAEIDKLIKNRVIF